MTKGILRLGDLEQASLEVPNGSSKQQENSKPNKIHKLNK